MQEKNNFPRENNDESILKPGVINDLLSELTLHEQLDTNVEKVTILI